MAVRVAMLTDPLDVRRTALWGALEECSDVIELRVLWPGSGRTPRASSRRGTTVPTRRGLPFGSMSQLVAYRPDLIISEDFGTLAMHAALYRSVSRRSRLLLCATEPPRQLGLRERMILGRADGVLANDDAVAQAVAQLPFPVSRIFPLAMPYELDAFLQSGAVRSGTETHRVAYAGELSPQSGAADLLISVASWAEQHPDRTAEIWWIGEGDLAGVLGAQPLPDNVSQRFLGCLEPAGMAWAFGQCSVLIVPSLVDDRRAPVAEGLAAGLPVLGSRRNRRVRQLVRDDVNGWLFDPVQPGDMSQALGRALGTSAEQLDRMRDKARALIRPSASPNLAHRISRAIAAVLPELVLEPLPQQIQ